MGHIYTVHYILGVNLSNGSFLEYVMEQDMNTFCFKKDVLYYTFLIENIRDRILFSFLFNIFIDKSIFGKPQTSHC